MQVKTRPKKGTGPIQFERLQTLHARLAVWPRCAQKPWAAHAGRLAKAQAEAGSRHAFGPEIDAGTNRAAAALWILGTSKEAHTPWPAAAWAGRRGACACGGACPGNYGVKAKAGADRYGDGTKLKIPRATDSTRRLPSSFLECSVAHVCFATEEAMGERGRAAYDAVSIWQSRGFAATVCQ